MLLYYLIYQNYKRCSACIYRVKVSFLNPTICSQHYLTEKTTADCLTDWSHFTRGGTGNLELFDPGSGRAVLSD